MQGYEGASFPMQGAGQSRLAAAHQLALAEARALQAVAELQEQQRQMSQHQQQQYHMGPFRYPPPPEQPVYPQQGGWAYPPLPPPPRMSPDEGAGAGNSEQQIIAAADGSLFVMRRVTAAEAASLPHQTAHTMNGYTAAMPSMAAWGELPQPRRVNIGGTRGGKRGAGEDGGAAKRPKKRSVEADAVTAFHPDYAADDPSLMASPRNGGGRFDSKPWAPGLSRYTCIYFNDTRWAVCLKSRKHRTATRVEADALYERECEINRLNPASKLRRGYGRPEFVPPPPDMDTCTVAEYSADVLAEAQAVYPNSTSISASDGSVYALTGPSAGTWTRPPPPSSLPLMLGTLPAWMGAAMAGEPTFSYYPAAPGGHRPSHASGGMGMPMDMPLRVAAAPLSADSAAATTDSSHSTETGVPSTQVEDLPPWR